MRQRKTPKRAIASLILAMLLTGCAADDQWGIEDLPPYDPPTEPDTSIAEPVSGTYEGTHTIALGAPPEEATHIRVEIRCLSAGVLELEGEDDFEITCVSPSEGTTASYSSIPISPGRDSIEVTTSDSTVRYDVVAVYENGASVG